MSNDRKLTQHHLQCKCGHNVVTPGVSYDTSKFLTQMGWKRTINKSDSRPFWSKFEPVEICDYCVPDEPLNVDQLYPLMDWQPSPHIPLPW